MPRPRVLPVTRESHPLDYFLVDFDGNVIAFRRSLGTLRTFARMSGRVIRYAHHIECPDGTSVPIITPRPTR